jgi:hypothetical protein
MCSCIMQVVLEKKIIKVEEKIERGYIFRHKHNYESIVNVLDFSI